MSVVHHFMVGVRRFHARHPWAYWAVAAGLAIGAAAAARSHTAGIESARTTWGTQRSVWVAARDLAPGEALLVERRVVPAAVVPVGALDDVAGRVARQQIGAGEIVLGLDVAATTGPRALIPPGWLAVPVVESPATGATIGDRVRVASEGVVLAADALVVGHHADTTLVGVPADDATLVAAAGELGRITLLLVP